MKVFGYITLLGLISGTVLGCKSGEPARTATPEIVTTQVIESKQEPVPVTVKITGTLHARESAILSAQVMGRVQQVLVHEGDSVRPGQTLVVLDDAALKSASEQAQAAMEAAEKQEAAAQSNADLAASTLARYQQLQTQKSVSPQEMDEVTHKAQAAAAEFDALRAQTNAMKAQQASARTMLSYARIVAPFAGLITARMVDPGALASPGIPLVQMDGTGPLQLQATVAESAIASVHIGMRVGVSVDGAPAESSSGTVSQIVPAADPSSHSFLIKIDLPSSRELHAGMYATTEVPTGSRQAITVPQSAIVVRGSLPCAYVLDSDGLAQLRYVTLGTAHADQVEVLSGISGNERLVDNPADRDLAGRKIEVQP